MRNTPRLETKSQLFSLVQHAILFHCIAPGCGDMKFSKIPGFCIWAKWKLFRGFCNCFSETTLLSWISAEKKGAAEPGVI